MKIVYKRLSSWLLGILGFAGCDVAGIGNMVDMYGTAAVMYGSPQATYKIDAKVTDTKGKPIEGIEMTVLEKSFVDDSYYKRRDLSNLTSSKGKANTTFLYYPVKENIAVAFTDIDGEDNGGTFQADTIRNISFKQTAKGDGKWNHGTYEASVSVKLDKQKK